MAGDRQPDSRGREMQTVTDRDAFATSGFPVLFVWIVVLGVAALLWPPLAIPVAVIGLLVASGFTDHPAQ